MPSARTLLVALLMMAAVAPAHASTVEDATAGAVSYQFDGDSHHDAPDVCTEASTEWTLPFGGTTDGLLLPPDDLADVFLVDVPNASVGSRLDVRLAEVADMDNLDMTVFAPGCAGSVFDLANQPSAEPSPPAPAPGEAQSGVENLDGSWTCDATRWFFVVNQLRGANAPPSIHVAWTEGTQQSVPLLSSSTGTAHYGTAAHLNVTLKGAWVNLPNSWSGNFRIGAGPCDAVEGGAVYGQPPVAGLGFVSFTPIQAGPHIVQVTVKQTPGLPGPPAPLVVPVSCHWCLAPVEGFVKEVSYQLIASPS